MAMFKREDIKAGYLLRCTNKKEGRQFNMTVVPCKENAGGFLFWTPATKNGDLAVCNPGTDWAPLASFNADLIWAEHTQVDEVWGYAAPAKLLTNTTEGRKLLWKRDTVKRMTMAEIEKALGHKVKVVKPGDPAPDLFKKSSMYAGMVVELRDGSKRLVMPSGEGLMLMTAPATMTDVIPPVCYLRMSEYHDGLVRRTDMPHTLDVMKVWDRPAPPYMWASFTTCTAAEARRLIWERDDTKRMTLEEIEKALGYKVEVVDPAKA